jgi:chlorophyll(ide) b reductase
MRHLGSTVHSYPPLPSNRSFSCKLTKCLCTAKPSKPAKPGGAIPPLSVVIVGGTKGLGRAIAREFLLTGDRVLITGRHMSGVAQALVTLRRQTGCRPQMLAGAVADCSSPRAMASMSDVLLAPSQMPVDIVIACAGVSGGFTAFEETDACVLHEIVSTTLGGAVLTAHAALRVFAEQRRRGSISRGTLWLLDGAGADGQSTPMYSAYGAAKAALRQLAMSLRAESPACAAVGIINPGLVVTDLLLENATQRNKAAFNVMAELPETAAARLVPRIRAAHGRVATHKTADVPNLHLLPPSTVALKMVAYPWTRRRFFDARGQPTFASEEARIESLMSQRHKASTCKRQLATMVRLASVCGAAAAAGVISALAQGPPMTG